MQPIAPFMQTTHTRVLPIPTCNNYVESGVRMAQKQPAQCIFSCHKMHVQSANDI